MEWLLGMGIMLYRNAFSHFIVSTALEVDTIYFPPFQNEKRASERSICLRHTQVSTVQGLCTFHESASGGGGGSSLLHSMFTA